jgi:hypothetical protein
MMALRTGQGGRAWSLLRHFREAGVVELEVWWGVCLLLLLLLLLLL